VGGKGVSGGGCAPLPPLPRGRVVPRWRRCAPPPPRRPAAPLPAAGPRPPGSHGSGAVAVGGAGCGLGGRTRLRYSPPARPPAAAHPRVCACGAAAASRQRKRTALHKAAFGGRAPCVESLLKAGADASLKNGVSDGAEGLGGRRGGGGPGPCSQAPRRLSAPPSPPPLSPPRAAAEWRHGVGRRQEAEAHGGHQAPGERPRHRRAGRPRRATPSCARTSIRLRCLATRPVPKAPSTL
jgi:hypothetical protein